VIGVDDKRVAVIGVCWIVSGLLAIIVGAYLNANPLPLLNCPNMQVYPTKAQVLTLLNATENGDTGCAIAALDVYGQGVLDAYNISVNLTELGTPSTAANKGTIFMVIGGIAIVAGAWIVLVRRRIMRMIVVQSRPRKARTAGRVRG
jgi:LPXTG-motif cell wall-anchored protein